MSSQIQIETFDVSCIGKAYSMEFFRYQTFVRHQAIRTYSLGAQSQNRCCHLLEFVFRPRANAEINYLFCAAINRIGYPDFFLLFSNERPQFINFVSAILHIRIGSVDCLGDLLNSFDDGGYRNVKYSCYASNTDPLDQQANHTLIYSITISLFIVFTLLVLFARTTSVSLYFILSFACLHAASMAISAFHHLTLWNMKVLETSFLGLQGYEKENDRSNHLPFLLLYVFASSENQSVTCPFFQI
jgi:hypothetical protein